LAALPLTGPHRAPTAPPPARHRAIAVLDRLPDLRSHLDGARAAGLRVGLVPTMGSLHEGHLSLVRRAAVDCDVVALTIFANPLQFDSREDLERYPRHREADIALAAGAGAGVVFVPTEAEMYPTPPTTTISVGRLGDVFEGASRPGHFAGVATVVAKLFNAAGPCRAYFGEKDWQQLLVVRRMVGDLLFPVEVVGCPTVREPDGLACSSRNVWLGSENRRAARSLFAALAGAAAQVEAGEGDAHVVRRRLAESVADEPLVTLDYAAVVRAADLAPLERIDEAGTAEVRLLVAAHVGGTRLIDNLAAPTDNLAAPSDRRP